ncbi:citrate/2-methylcitrate synthase [Phaeobacter gallaeciensis]|jgi:citrate synthase|uniref:citrate/2-methylcitrate synthase n=1 Tax=Phaeobacter gallaeciensis TaxID=60890 RepID=UPI00237F327B|nr:citrate/2-methylcitrate synthase [Phaeobacter gallaeciensis]MDE4097480.1 citrate/2-methylcitrate synthase [Phaeobacter gallaeciensis]MDE4106006.1 citrate/2-methylcitrate synthase [Phaeobacter gallaeciensis]MDE4110744.1 citrate/2-methylcitrate synthase [Phaeobacter gallaeciensis]MDE4115215.1 citrate/2-methylcitrate synthase [Phaeobacter gallaeciensis]MDE4119684.1 citrate/2-methylcitrate synthase [Phaeobacter gallaeciensis]
MSENVKINRGLKGVYFERSGVSDIDGAKGELSYRGYSIHDLATHSTFEEVCYLLIYGELPTAGQLADFDADLKAARVLPDEIHAIIRACKDGHPMDVLRTCVSALAALEPASQQVGEEAFLANGVRLTSQVPMIIAAHEAIRNGRNPVAPDMTLGHAANWLWMLKGEKPSADAARLADVDFILHAEHGSNASSFAARVTVGTEANLHGAIVTALSTLAGPAHGGAAEDVMKMVHEIGTPDKAAAYVKAKRAAKEAVTGFGHRVYRKEDPRARHMREGVRKLGEEMGAPEWYEILQAVVEAMSPYARHGLNVNVDFYSGVIYQLHGIPMDLYVPIFAIGRMPGWVIQCVEQQRGNILIRPLTLYNGPEPRGYVQISDR